LREKLKRRLRRREKGSREVGGGGDTKVRNVSTV